MSTVRLLVLGVVRMHGAAHGYAVHRELTSWRVDTWTKVKPPSIYHTVKQLAREGFLQDIGRTENSRGPARVEYLVTATGEREFFRLLEAALLNPDIEEFGAGIALMRFLPRRRVLELLEAQLGVTRTIGDELQDLKAQWPDPAEPPHAQHLLDLWRGTFAATSDWTAQMLARVAGGEFTFADDAGPRGDQSAGSARRPGIT
ncbi:PadR family transcriptional regulator [Mycobacterium manitobense]|uniref:PadR family transcriptional regulator n=1 Tax=[Mycobacterium] manitobense TaxID=190147 RepID=A0A9X3BVM2_9MYCO|nr:PadR family transcriptional regulator [[Mycobacterium] manitobense]MCV7171963.1 PadR family transcriptional regulator [[Mycobacterium] manitobense]